MSEKNYNVLDLFCGCGGLSKGFEQAGYNILLGIDFDKAALETFQFNHKSSKSLQIDLSTPAAFSEIDNAVEKKNIDVIIGGPPCQGFSLTGPRNFDDKRNKLYLAVFEAVKHYKPKAFLIENVPGMANLYNGAIKDEIIRRFTALGYSVKSQVVCAADYGVPQIRKRLVFVGLRNTSISFDFPTPYLCPDEYISCQDALSDLPPLDTDLGTEEAPYCSNPQNEYQRQMRKNSISIHNHSAVNHKDFVKETIALVPDGGNYKDLPQGVGESRVFHMAWTRLNSQLPSRTVDCGHRNIFHYKFNRCPTVRENARLQSFPDDFIFRGNRGQQNKQVGNAVPVLLAKALGLQLLNYLK